MAYRENVQVGHVVEIIRRNRDDQQGLQVIGQVTGVAEDWVNPDQLRLMIAGLDMWLSLDDNTMIERLA
jgi:uncharacterized protein YbjT (DUF2867 family)